MVPNGAALLCKTLEALRVSCVFGVPGSQNIVLYEALRRSGIRTVLATHELAASFMANGYHRASGRVAPLVTIPGPGFTYALTGLAEAKHDSAAVLHLVGQPPRSGKRFELQAVDQYSIGAPLVKAIFTIDHVDEIPSRTAEALDSSMTGEPGPVLLHWSPAALVDTPARRLERSAPRRRARCRANGARMEEAVARVGTARRPVLIVGQGCVGATRQVRRLAESLGAPVITTTSGRGILPEDHPLALGFDSARNDGRALNQLLQLSDLVLALGCKLTWGSMGGPRLALPEDRLVQVDASEEVLGAAYRCALTVTATVELFLERVLGTIKRPPLDASDRWDQAEIQIWRERVRALDATGDEPAVHGVERESAAVLFAALRHVLPRDGVLVTDTGLHQTLVRRHFDVLAHRGLIIPSDFQSMGFGLPAAIGVKLAAPRRAVVAIVGDGGFAMSGMEILTAVRERIPLTIVVFNDGRLNRIRLEQLARFGRSASVDLLNPDFETFSAAVGAQFVRVDGDAKDVLSRAIGGRSVTLVEVLLRDSRAIHLVRAKGLARGAADRALRPDTLKWLKRKLRRR